ncbi:MAG: permease [Gemmataceae bacterium]
MSYSEFYPLAAEAVPSERVAFIRRTYNHLAGALVAFVGLEALLLNLPVAEQSVFFLASSRWSWLLVLGCFIAVAWAADRWAQSDMPVPMQYVGLGLYVVAEALLFMPLLYVADRYFPGTILSAGLLTLGLFLALTTFVFVTGKDFSFLRGTLFLASLVAFLTILAAIIAGFQLGVLFSALMILLAGGYILYDTSNVLHHYRTNQHVAASLALFASVVLLFWYILRLLMALQRR